jgi:hypothetical protein
MSRHVVINPHAEQNNRIPGHQFITEHLTNVGLPGIPPYTTKGCIPFDLIRRRAPYKDEDDGWTEVIDKRNRRRERLTRSGGGGGGGWIGRAVPVTPVFGRKSFP